MLISKKVSTILWPLLLLLPVYSAVHPSCQREIMPKKKRTTYRANRMRSAVSSRKMRSKID
jgi:hypothetical protein